MEMEDETITRRAMLGSLTNALASACILGALGPGVARAAAPPTLTVYKDPSCGCCTKWVEHLRANGLAPAVKDRTDMDAFKDSLGIPGPLRSCHTAVAGKYVIEGHVPAADVKRFLSAPPKSVIGLAVPGMPVGSPGMEQRGRTDRYDVMAFTARGTTHVYAKHG